ncbi:hypothetical protein QUF54_00470 [Candidatus Marithioploca araucensis]|uniref:Uncharacterized protein n=1 Tax=Candidatus Marithioploca araucensis TaxID=70273 RepID=A0ABT7VQ85_9GAMM|nr:hypothetical protein [Candidatus Marithioploca araucensis]
MKNKLKDSTVAGAFLLASTSALGKEAGQFPPIQLPDEAGQRSTPPSSQEAKPSNREAKPAPENPFQGKSNSVFTQRFQIESISLDEASKKKVEYCPAPKSVKRKKRPRPQHTFSLAFDAKKRQIVGLQFEVSNIPASKEERVLVLLYSRCLSRKSKIKTRKSKHKLKLDSRDLEIMGNYNVPIIEPIKTPSGKATSPATQQITFKVDLDTNHLAQQLKAENDTFYFQAALLKKSDYKKEKYADAILSPLEAINVTSGKKCPTKKELRTAINSDNKACKALPTKTE